MSALKLANPGSPDPPAPDHLSDRSRAVWERTVRDYAMRDDVAGLHILAKVLEAEDLAERCRALIASDGEYIKARGNEGGKVPHPMIRVQMRAMAEARAGWKQLGLVPPQQPNPRRPGRPTATAEKYRSGRR
jgi:hypothetical protein